MNDPTCAATQPAVRIELIGQPRLVSGGLPASELGRLDAALLALIVLEGGLDRARVAALLWPDADARRAGLSLRQRIFRLNRSAGAEVVVGTRRLLLATAVRHDVGLLLAGAGPTDAEPARGELLGMLDYVDAGELAGWVAAARDRWRAVRRDALAGAAERLEAAGQLAPALRLAERLLEHEPQSEHAHRRVMRLHYLRGDRSAALHAYERCVRGLRDLLGEAPGAETAALIGLIERSGPPVPSSAASKPARLPQPPGLLRPPRLVGREPAWRSLDDAAALGRPVLVTGEPGIGKTRLLGDRVQVNGPGVLVDARPGDHRVPYALLARLLEGLAERHGQPPEDDVCGELALLRPGALPAAAALSPARPQAAVARELARAAAAGLHLVALDDLQCADDASLEILLPLTLDTGGPRWLMAVRSAERPILLQRWQDEADSGTGAIELALQALPAAAVLELLDSLALPDLETVAWAQALQSWTGGHPMLLLETLRAAWAEQGRLPARPGALPRPLSLDRLIAQRLQPLDAAARRLLQLAALADIDFSVALATRVLQVHALDLAASWQALEQCGVFTRDHVLPDLVREAVLGSVPEPIARTLHAEIAEQIGIAGAPAARVAEHLHRAGRWLDAAHHWRRAAADALAAGRRREEAELLQAAADDLRRGGAEAAAFEADCDRLGALVQCAGGDEVRAAVQTLQQCVGDHVDLARGAVAIAEAQIVFGEFEAVVAAMPEAISRLVDDPEAVVLGTRRLAVALLNLGRAEEAAQVLSSCLPRLDAVPSERARYEFLGEFGTVLERCNRRREGFEHLQRGIALALQARDVGTAATMYANLGVNRVYWGDAEAAIAATEQGLALRQQHDGLAGLASGMDMTLGAMCRDAGRLGEAIERLERSHAAFVADGNALWTANTASHLALLWLQLGQWARAARVLQGDVDGLPAFIAARVEAARALLDEAHDRSALPGLDRALARLAGADRVDVRLGIQLERARLLQPADALALADDVANEARQAELMGHALGAEVLAVDALRRAGCAAEAASRAAGLVDAASPLGPSGFYRPALWLALLRALRAGGRSDEARRYAQHARAGLLRARSSLPAVFHESHDQRQPVNRALLADS